MYLGKKEAGQWTKFKAFVHIEDYNGRVALGMKCSKEELLPSEGPSSLCREAPEGARLVSSTLFPAR